MSYALGVVFFVVALLTSVMLHEAGHFATAKRFGMKATRFFVGFGPTLWSTTRGETEYGVKAIPAGGFVKIIGMTPLEETEPGDEDRVFWRQPAGRRTVVLAAGSIVHFLIAIVLVFGVLATVGDLTKEVTKPTISGVAQCFPKDVNATACSPGDPKTPAYGALHAGDRIVAVDGTPTPQAAQIRSAIQSSAGRPLTLTIRHGTQTRTVRLTPVATVVDGKTVGRLGFGFDVAPKPVSVAAAVPRTFGLLGEFTTSTVKALGDLPHEVSTILQGKQRNTNGAASVVDIARVSGQIGQAHTGFGLKLAELLLIIASLNFFVGVFNLLPLLPLDGGHIAILAFEQARSAFARLVGRPDPGRVDIMKVMPVTYAVVALFVGLSLILLYAGIVNPIKIQ